jgi:ATP-binding cassette subfamily B (MDR/TAP) protein 1
MVDVNINNQKAGIAFGFSQFSVMAVFAVLFYAAGCLMENNHDLDPGDVFIAIFSMMFGAQSVGNSQQFGPDLGKSIAAAKRIFGIIDQPSRIDAVAIDKDMTKVRIMPTDHTPKFSKHLKVIEGKIEFKDVWFRYPTRKADWVLRGLNLTINPNETVALVGESGCGKSTFVSLLMRFYDVDFGEILIDGVNVKDYNLHDMR